MNRDAFIIGVMLTSVAIITVATVNALNKISEAYVRSTQKN